MIALGAVVLEFLACVGFGAMALRLLGALADVPWGERLAVAFACGFGVLGWVLFPVGVAGGFENQWLLAILFAGVPGVVLLGRPAFGAREPVTLATWVLLGVLAVVLFLNLAQALAPPTDADSVAYHFAHPKRFLLEGGLVFIPRVADGATPLLIQLTYVPVLGLGGETAMTLWTMASGSMAAWFVYALARNWLGREWSLAAALVFMTTPAVIYGAGSGQVEVRLALFALLAAWALGRSWESGEMRWTVVAGVGAGFFVGGKFTGLLFAAGCGLLLILRRRFLVHGAAFSAVVIAAGASWYWWNWLHTGDPVFPMLFRLLGPENYQYWDKAHDDFLRASYFGSDVVLPRTPFWFVAFPFQATLFPSPRFEAGRTGLGPFLWLILPFAAAAAWRFRRKISRDRLLALLALGVVFYVIWFGSGVSQKIRHMTSVLPLLLIPLLVAAERFGRPRALAAAVALCVGFQISVLGVFSLTYLRHLFEGESREAFLERTYGPYPVIRWANETLDAKAHRIMVPHRETLFYYEVPYFMGTVRFQNLIDLREGVDSVTVAEQMRAQGVTHVLGMSEDGAASGYAKGLVDGGCMTPVMRHDGAYWTGRTLSAMSRTEMVYIVYRLKDDACRSS